MRGYFGVGIQNGKTEANLGTLWRSAQALGASFIFTIGKRYSHQASDTSKAWKHIPLFEYGSLLDFSKQTPRDCLVVGVEYPHEAAKALGDFVHPERCIYLLGSEDTGLSKDALARCHHVIHIPAKLCLNVAVAGSIVMYDRVTQHSRPGS